MAKRKFVINKYNGYSIRNHYFKSNPSGRGCTLETDDPAIIRLVENAEGYGIYIHPAETPEELAAMKAAELPPVIEDLPQESEAEPPIATQGARGTLSARATRRGQIINPKEK